jgi:folate-dependent phosphoribosylglycinamide formyltransferase PurN
MTNIRKKAAILLSGTGSNAQAILEYIKNNPNSSYEVVYLFTDNPKGSRTKKLSKLYNIPMGSCDIKEFYLQHGEESIKLDTPKRRALREEWTKIISSDILSKGIDFIIMAGFVPLTNLASKIPCLNVHPGDLTITDKDGIRLLAGLHIKPVENAILNEFNYLRSSVILVQPYQGDGKDQLDGGPVLGVSPKMDIDYMGYTLEELKTINKNRTSPPFDDALRKIAHHNVERLKVKGDHVVFPLTIEEYAKGAYSFSQDKMYWNKKEVLTIEYSTDKIVEILA